MTISRSVTNLMLALGLSFGATMSSAQESGQAAEATAPASISTDSAAESGAAAADPTSEAVPESEWLKVYFPTGSSRIGPDQSDVLDTAARTFREGDPYVMIISGGADTVGNAANNLDLSLKRAEAVAAQLSARGIPVGRLQVLGRGNSELEVPTDDGVAEPGNRVVQISWR